MNLLLSPHQTAGIASVLLDYGHLSVEKPREAAAHVRVQVVVPIGLIPVLADCRRLLQAGNCRGNRWTIVSAQAREVLAWLRPLNTREKDRHKRFEQRAQTLELLYPDAIHGGMRARRARMTHEQ